MCERALPSLQHLVSEWRSLAIMRETMTGVSMRRIRAASRRQGSSAAANASFRCGACRDRERRRGGFMETHPIANARSDGHAWPLQ